MATLPCSRVRMTAIRFLSQELGTLGCQVHMARKGVEVHGFNGGGGVAQLGIEGSCSRCIHFSMPILRGVASPGHLHIHELICRKNGHNLIVDLWVILEGFQREADSLITDGPHDHVFTVIRDWGHRNLHHHLYACWSRTPALPRTCPAPDSIGATLPGIGVFQGCWHPGTAAPHPWSSASWPGVPWPFLPVPWGTLDHQGHLTPDAVQLLHGPSIAIDVEQSRQGPSLGLPLPIALLIIVGLVANQLPPASSHPPQCRGTG